MRVVFLAAALMLLPLASAGTMDDPEITDPVDDHAVTGIGSDPEGLVKSVDLIAGWVVGLEDGMLELRLQASQELRGGSVEGNPTTEYEYTFHFEAGGEAFAASGHVVGNPPEVTPGGVATEAVRDEADTSVLVLRVPAGDVGVAPGDILTGLYAESRVFTSGGDIATDRAPDEDFGRDAELASDAPEVVNLTGPPFSASLAADAENGTYAWSWNASEHEYDLSLSTSADAECVDADVEPIPCIANLTIMAAGAVVHTCDDCDGIEINRVVDAMNGTWNVTVTKQGPATFSFSVAEHATTNTTTSATTTPPPENTTTTGAPPTEDGADSSAVWLPLVAVALLGAARRMQAKR